ncbi:peptidylprolyl isomerase [Glycocaulis sp.]|uniref:peptidylprolyl isomerase n=1 Tax=Glycocaulis sp. TaxID=1969725 RepID=UPI0025BAC70D|nr:peptidylprolyl isomerase [Glycocaulis sp.]MCH8521855.1 peptidylprolyl isomerase [Glycocaulis sp.]
MPMTTLKRLAVCLAMPLGLALSAPAAAQQVEGIAAIVNDQPITTFDVRDRMRLILSSAGIQPTEDVLVQVQEQAMRSLIEEALQLQTARRFEVPVSEEEVDEAIADIAARNGITVEEIRLDLEQSGVSIDTLRQQLRAEIAWSYLVSGRYRSRIRVTDAQIDTALERLAESASQTQYRVAEIMVNLPASGDESVAEQRMAAVYNALEQGAPFPAIASQFSDAPTAATGGDAGWLSAGQMRPQVAQMIQQMPVGSISNPIRVPGGYMIVAVADRREGQATEQISLQQITLLTSQVTDERRQALTRAAQRVSGCNNLASVFEAVPQAIITDLGTVGANALVPNIRQALSGLQNGQASPVLETGAGLQVFVLCDRRIGGPGMPGPSDVENQIVNQQLSMLARRWLRDLRNDATVEMVGYNE